MFFLAKTFDFFARRVVAKTFGSFLSFCLSGELKHSSFLLFSQRMLAFSSTTSASVYFPEALDFSHPLSHQAHRNPVHYW